MQTSAAPTGATGIARRQGLLLGGGIGMVVLIITLVVVLVPQTRQPGVEFGNTSYPLPFLDAVALLAFFVAGWRAGQRTGRIDIGALAGFWAGLVMAVIGIVINILLFIGSYPLNSSSINSLFFTSVVFETVLSVLRDGILAILFGAGIGALGGFVGRTYASALAGQTPPQSSVQDPTQTAQP